MKPIDYTDIIGTKIKCRVNMQKVLERLKEISKEHNIIIITAKQPKK